MRKVSIKTLGHNGHSINIKLRWKMLPFCAISMNFFAMSPTHSESSRVKTICWSLHWLRHCNKIIRNYLANAIHVHWTVMGIV